MNFALDRYAHLDSPIHSWDPRIKLIAFLVLIFTFSSISEPFLLPAILLVTFGIVIASKLPVRFILARWRYPSIFLLIVVIILPFLSGSTVLASLGPINIYEEGLRSVLLIGARFFAILTTGIILFGTAPFLTTIRAMRALGLPGILADTMLLAFRYLFEIGDYLHRMETALRLRGFRARRFSLKGLGTLAWLGGTILVRSYERSEWIYKAMIIRGYGQKRPSRSDFRSGASDFLKLLVFVIIAVGLVIGKVLL